MKIIAARKINHRLLLSFATIFASLAIIIGAAFAFLSDTETSTDNTFEAGVLDLQIDNESYYNGAVSEHTTWELDSLDEHLFFDFRDLKPGDWGEDTISIHVNDNDAWGCFDSTLTSDDDNGSNEPELLVDVEDDEEDDFDGELGAALNFVFWVDDGDNVLEDDEIENIIAEGPADEVLSSLSVTLADSLSSLFVDDGNPLVGGTTYYIAKAWCFGDLEYTPVTPGENSPLDNPGISCDGSNLDNSTQTDVLTADISFSIQQFRNNPDFLCEDREISCEEEDAIYASSFQDEDQGLRKDGTAVLANRSIPGAAFGAPETSGADSDVGFPAGSFYSLGFPNVNDNGSTASIVFGFAEPFYNGPGDDLQVYEVTGGVYPDEKVKIEASKDGIAWTLLAASAVRDEAVDLGPLDFANYVRLTDVSDIGLFPNDADGYDIDAIKAFCTESETTPTLTPTPTPDEEEPEVGGLVINEVMFDPPNTNACGNEIDAEWVEIYNPTGSAVNLDSWSIGDTLFTDGLPNVSLPAGGFAIVASNCDEDDFDSIWPLADGAIYIDLGSAIGNGLNNGGEHMRLLNGATLIDAVSYGSNTTAFSPSVPAPVANHSIERDPDGVDTDTAADFVDRNPPTPGS